MKTTAKLLTMIFLLSIFFGLSVGSVLASQKDWYGKVGGVNVHASKWAGLGGYMWSTDLPIVEQHKTSISLVILTGQ